MKIGFALPHYDFSFPDHRPVAVRDVVGYAQRAEALGFDSVWVSDHLFLDIEKYGGAPGRHRTPDALTVLGAIACETERVRFGTLVLCASFRHPRLLAHSIRTLMDASGGRFDCGLGAGWYEPEFLAAGIPFGTAGQRIERMRVIAGHLDAHFGDELPMWIGGKGGPKVASVIAEHADGWNVVWRITPDELAARLVGVRDAFAAAKRVASRRCARGGRASSARIRWRSSRAVGSSARRSSARRASKNSKRSVSKRSSCRRRVCRSRSTTTSSSS